MLIDLRSDTVTRPTKEMLDAMMKAEVGDDVFNEDPTVIALENKIATMFGKEAALFCPSGTMCNQTAINIHTKPGDEVICDVSSHIYQYESGGVAANSGVQTKLLVGDRGRLSAKQIEESINLNFDWLTRTSLVSLENTANRAGGSVYTLEQMQEISDLCHAKKLNSHLDGARIFNALTVTGDKPRQVGELFDSVSICFSKGLGAPVGSALMGSKEFVASARRVRKRFGGGMRQAGYLAAACIFTLENNIARLKDDHQRASVIGKTLEKLPYVKGMLPVETNIIIFTLNEKLSSDVFVKKLAEHNIKAVAFGTQTIRFVTHLDFTDVMLQKTVDILKKI
ncbi:MAG: aminotransferase class I/II-fold pyridoxal phosphate-dependent enzyme [Bacteroidia bacterium]|nr:aminotransferase class I/II-fold pyridoxal phosphate-dependent enzyme [Bacteroidia bacterium]